MKTSNSKLLFAQLFTRKLHRGEKTKLRMIESGIEVLATKGLDHFTFEEVGRRVKMNRAQVKYHYKDKHELLRHCFEYVVIEGQSRVV